MCLSSNNRSFLHDRAQFQLNASFAVLLKPSIEPQRTRRTQRTQRSETENQLRLLLFPLFLCEPLYCSLSFSWLPDNNLLSQSSAFMRKLLKGFSPLSERLKPAQSFRMNAEL